MYKANQKYFSKLVNDFDVTVSVNTKYPAGNFVKNADINGQSIVFIDVIKSLTARIKELEDILQDRIVLTEKEHAMLLLRHKGDEDV